MGTTWYGVRRSFLDGTTAFYGPDTDSWIGPNVNADNEVQGLGLSRMYSLRVFAKLNFHSADNSILYVSRGVGVEVWDPATRGWIVTWNIGNSGAVAVDSMGNVWVAPLDGTGYILSSFF